MSELTITIPYWLPSAEGALWFAAWYVIAANAAFLVLLYLTRNNRRFGLAPSLLRAKTHRRAAALVACFAVVWPIAVVIHAVNMHRWKREGRRL